MEPALHERFTNLNASHLLVYFHGVVATRSNCGKPLKLQVPSQRRTGADGQVNCLGYGNNPEDVHNGQSAAKLLEASLDSGTEKVQRLDGRGFDCEFLQSSLRYSPTFDESRRKHIRCPCNGSLRLNLTQHGETHQVQTQRGLTD